MLGLVTRPEMRDAGMPSQNSGDVNIVYPQEGRRLGRSQKPRQMSSRQDPGGAAAEHWVLVIAEIVVGDGPPPRALRPAPFAVAQKRLRSLCSEILQDAFHQENVNENIVVCVQRPGNLRAVVLYPGKRRQRLQRQLTVMIHVIALKIFENLHCWQ